MLLPCIDPDNVHCVLNCATSNFGLNPLNMQRQQEPVYIHLPPPPVLPMSTTIHAF